MFRSDHSKVILTLALAFASASWGCGSDKSSSTKDAAAKDGGGTKDGAAADTSTSVDAASGGDAAPKDGATPDGTAGDGPGPDTVVLNAMQARGKYLVDHVIACPDCHTPLSADGMTPDFSKYMAGGVCFIPDTNDPKKCALASRNLTSDETGLKNYTDDEIKDMFLNGKRPVTTHETLVPVMPYYVFRNMKDEDATAIVAYLRIIPPVKSMDATRLPPFDQNPPPAPALTLAKVPAVPDTYPDKASAERGKYLASQAGICIECHTKRLAPGALSVLDEDKFFQGGEDFSGFFPPFLKWKVVSKNITSDMATGIGDRTVDDIVTELLKGTKKDKSPLCPPMPVGPMGAFGGLTMADATDIANYIHSVPAKTNDTGMNMCNPPPPPPDGGADGGGADGG